MSSMADTSHLPDTVVRRLLERKFWNDLRFANMSYTDPGERTNVGDYEYDPGLSTEQHAVWHNHRDQVSHHSPRGTWVKRDIVSDAVGVVFHMHHVLAHSMHIVMTLILVAAPAV